METTALIIGRFQPFHLGHLILIEEAAKEADLIVIGIGSSQESNTKENPFTAQERRNMIESSLKINKKFSIVDVPDINNDKLWVSHVEKLLPRFNVVYTNEELERRLFKEKGYRINATGFFNRKKYSGVEIRQRIIQGKKWEHLVPKGTLKVMRKINGVERIKSLR